MKKRFKAILALVLIGVGLLTYYYRPFAAFAYEFTVALIRYDLLDLEDLDAIIESRYDEAHPDAENHQPAVCLGFNDARGKFEPADAECAPDHAFFSNGEGSGETRPGTGEHVPISGACCMLPSTDILSDEHVYNVTGTCPDNYVVTSGTSRSCGRNCTVRCTRINTTRYRLGPVNPALYWIRDGTRPAAGRGFARQIKHHRIPLAIRYSAGPQGPTGIGGPKDGCVGNPFGSLLVGKDFKTCDGFLYRQLQFSDGTPVRMFPDCAALLDPSQAATECRSDKPKNN